MIPDFYSETTIAKAKFFFSKISVMDTTLLRKTVVYKEITFDNRVKFFLLKFLIIDARFFSEKISLLESRFLQRKFDKR